MRYRLLTVVVAVKVLMFGVWFLAGPDVLNFTRQALAEVRPEQRTTAPAEKASPPPSVPKFSNPDYEKEKGLLEAISRRQKELDAREQELFSREERLDAMEEDIDAKIAELEKIHEDIKGFVTKIDEVNDDRIKRIVKIYESMRPEESAKRLEKLNDEMAVMILATMKERKAAKVLALVNVERSVKLSQMLKVRKD